MNRNIFLAALLLCLFFARPPEVALGAATPSDANDLRKFPYPYQAMLSITSDIDDTKPAEFFVYHRFLNTVEATDFGTGLGLDVGDSFWVYAAATPRIKGVPSSEDAIMSWFYGVDSTRPKCAAQIKRFYDCGWIDSMHTYGDFSLYGAKQGVAPTRELARTAWQALIQAGVRPTIWINHGDVGNVQNFGDGEAMRYQAGDVPQSPAYHTDLAITNGVRYIWDSDCKGTFGQKDPLYPIKLRDGRRVWGFSRYTGYQTLGGWKWQWNPACMGEVLAQGNLDQIVRDRQYAILATHLGAMSDYFPFTKDGIDGLRRLKSYEDDGKILVARTSRLLDYALAQKYTQYVKTDQDGKLTFDIRSINDPVFGSRPATLDKVRGLTFYVPDAQAATITIGGAAVPESEMIRGTAEGKHVIGLRWFPKDTTDYTRSGAATAKFETGRVSVNGRVGEMASYVVNHFHYYRLRDIAGLLSGTESAFTVDWLQKEKMVQIKTRQTGANSAAGEVFSPPADRRQDRTVVPGDSEIMLDRSAVALSGYLIDGSNYYKLRDLADLTGFSVDWNPATKTVVLKTSAKGA